MEWFWALLNTRKQLDSQADFQSSAMRLDLIPYYVFCVAHIAGAALLLLWSRWFLGRLGCPMGLH